MTINKFGAMTLLSVTALSLGFGAFVSRAHAEIGVKTESDIKVDFRSEDNNKNDDDHDDDKKGGDTSDGRVYKGADDHSFSGITGTVTAVGSTTLTVTAKNGTVYTVATGEAKFQKEKGTPIMMSDIKVGDTVLIEGSVSGTNVIAKKVIDTRIAVQKMEDRKENDNGNHYGFFNRFGNFFRNIFKARGYNTTTMNLNNTSYRLSYYNGTVIASDQNYTLTFNDGKLSAKFCNSMSGGYSLKDKVITASLASTMMACSDANLMTMESSFGAALQEGATLTADKDAHTLTLKSKAGIIFVFAKQ
jgi:heat shock protein HslJ/preprotein translocase subunit YajC